MPKPNKALLIKGVVCTCLGLAVVAAPYVFNSYSIRATMASVSLIGWFVLMMGAMMILRYIKPVRADTKKMTLTSPVLKQRPPHEKTEHHHQT